MLRLWTPSRILGSTHRDVRCPSWIRIRKRSPRTSAILQGISTSDCSCTLGIPSSLENSLLLLRSLRMSLSYIPCGRTSFLRMIPSPTLRSRILCATKASWGAKVRIRGMVFSCKSRFPILLRSLRRRAVVRRLRKSRLCPISPGGSNDTRISSFRFPEGQSEGMPILFPVGD